MMSIVSSDTIYYAGFIQNASEEGLAYKSYSFAPTAKKLPPKKRIKLILEIPSRGTLKLSCEIKWSSDYAPWTSMQDYTIFEMGMKIIDPPWSYREYVKKLQHE